MPRTTAAPAKRIYTIPSGLPFLATLARALLAGELPVAGGAPPGPLELADVTLLLPTRRATAGLQRAFLESARGAALLLPKVRPIFARAEDGDLLATLAAPVDGAEATPPAAIGDIARQLALTRLVLAWGRAASRVAPEDALDAAGASASRPAQARMLARELTLLIDELEIAGIAFPSLDALVPDTLAAHWQRTLAFLRIVTEHWPAHLAEAGLISPVAQDRRQIQALIARLGRTPPTAPIIVAGVMSSNSLVAELLAAVAALPNGAIVLPGLDLGLDEASWQAIAPDHPEHPQFGMKRMLDALGVARQEVGELTLEPPSAAQRARAALVSEALRPAQTTEHWRALTARRSAEIKQAASGLVILDAPTLEDEAEAIALILRRTAETPGQTAALVTPDRALARRVAARLTSLGLPLADAAGRPLPLTPVGAFIDLVIAAAAGGLEPVATMSLLKHPLCRAGMDAEGLARACRTIELALFRAPFIAGGELATALRRARARGGARLRRLAPEDWRAAEALLAALKRAFAPLTPLFASPEETSLSSLVAAHLAACETLAQPPMPTAESLWQGRAGEEASRFLAELLDPSAPAPYMHAADYADFYRSLAGEVTVREAGPVHPDIAILEPYESRLQQCDVMVLGSLNEGVWPEAADAGPWLSRPMRRALGLPEPEEKIGDGAHIVSSLLGAERVYLTRAVKRDGAPTVPSRWLLRLRALLEPLHVHTPPAAEPPWLAWAAARGGGDRPPCPASAPAPRPALSLRPRRLSVTSIATWMANPYALYARRILGLEPLPRLGCPPDAALRGEIVHAALGRFAQAYPRQLPANTERELLACAEAALAELTGSPRVAAFWAPRFARFAAWFAETEPARRESARESLAEVDGTLELAGPGGPFTLTARADRIDVGDDGLVIADYKGGANVKERATRAAAGLEPQLPLEAAIAAAGGFAGLSGPVLDLRFISTSGGEPPGAECSVNGKRADIAGLAQEARAGLERLIAAYDAPATPYAALRRPRFVYRFDAYAHLARVAEWCIDIAEDA
jgi:ATP-dependent helicase/nuclease subunit B